ncbi:MAG: GxGYxYP domain-containing protein, partial [Clostridium sp.]
QNCSINLNNTSADLDCLNSIDTNTYIKNTIIPKNLYVINENNMTKAEQTMIATLQGLIASKTDNQIYILSSSEPDYEIWLNDLKNSYNVKYRVINNPWDLINKFKSFINGYVLYSSSKSPSINNACTLASLKNSIAIDESIEWILNKHGVTNLIKDCRDTDKYWAFDNLWDSGLNHSTVIELAPDKFTPLRDYAILSKSLIFYEEDVHDYDLREKIFSSMCDNGRILGWGPDEHGNVSLASKYGINMIASDWSYNLSVLSSFNSESYMEKNKKEIKNEDGFHYVTFIMSDGDNQQWLLGSNYSNKNWFGSPYRKDFNLGWSLNPSLYYLAPTVFNKYYESDDSDNFVTAPSGNGYMYPSKFPQDKLSNYTNILNDYMKLVNQHYVLILDDEAFYRKDLWDKYTCNSNIDGLLYLNYDKNNSYEGKIVWSNNKPVVSCRDLLWAGLEDENELIANINNRVLAGYTKIDDIQSYTFVYVHVWSNTMDNVYNVVNTLNKNPKVKIISPNNFMQLIKNNV